jgi:hypothetical protein
MSHVTFFARSLKILNPIARLAHPNRTARSFYDSKCNVENALPAWSGIDGNDFRGLPGAGANAS